MKKIIPVLILLSTSANALDIQSKLKNTDKGSYIVNPTAHIQDKLIQMGVDLSFTKDPLVLKSVYTQKTDSLIKDIKTLDVNASFKIMSNLQIGGEVGYHQFNSNMNKSYGLLDSVLIEAKYSVFNKFAIIPFYMLGSNKSIQINNYGTKENIQIGKQTGAYGLKLAYDLPLLKANKISFFTSYTKSMNQDIYKNIDQTNVISFGSSFLLNLTKNSNWKNEFYMSQTPNNMPLEILSYYNYNMENMQVNFGAGSGDLQMSGANKYRVFANINITFGSMPKFNLLQSHKPPAKGNYEVLQESQENDQELNKPTGVINNESSSIPSHLLINRQIASEDNGVYKKLPNGKKVKVFKTRITKIPTEIGEIYTTEKDFQEMSKKIASEMKKNKKSKIEKKVVVLNEKIEAQPLVIEEQKKETQKQDQIFGQQINVPLKNNSEFAAEIKKELTLQEQKTANRPSSKILQEDDDKDPINMLVDNITKPLFDNNVLPAELAQPVSKIDESTKEDPILNHMEEQQVKAYVKQDNYVEELSFSKQTENELLEQLIQKKIADKEKKEQEDKKQEIIKSVIFADEKQKQSPVLMETQVTKKEELSNDKKVIMTDKESKPINVLSKKIKESDLVIKLPKVEIKTLEVKKKEIETKIEKKQEIQKQLEESEDHLILNETNDIEEANNPVY